ncbi:hypothetical protein ZOSMA_9G01760 [Zostera marina]|uniref:Uncharacterized protein n=1 Tax=Zostera marina TaxID=29655 RepID=A0A0K9NH43_ZOSMR|nr:hypothetical protein ZOSMA_9G01760 [Zostera marina]
MELCCSQSQCQSPNQIVGFYEIQMDIHFLPSTSIRGDSIDQSNLLWTANASSMFEFSSIMHVFAVTNTAREPCDFKIRKKSFHSGDSDAVVAKIKTINKLQNFLKLKETRRLEIFQEVDLSFIVSLCVVLDMFKKTKRRSRAAGVESIATVITSI